MYLKGFNIFFFYLAVLFGGLLFLGSGLYFFFLLGWGVWWELWLFIFSFMVELFVRLGGAGFFLYFVFRVVVVSVLGFWFYGVRRVGRRVWRVVGIGEGSFWWKKEAIGIIIVFCFVVGFLWYFNLSVRDSFLKYEVEIFVIENK